MFAPHTRQGVASVQLRLGRLGRLRCGTNFIGDKSDQLITRVKTRLVINTAQLRFHSCNRTAVHFRNLAVREAFDDKDRDISLGLRQTPSIGMTQDHGFLGDRLRRTEGQIVFALPLQLATQLHKTDASDRSRQRKEQGKQARNLCPIGRSGQHYKLNNKLCFQRSNGHNQAPTRNPETRLTQILFANQRSRPLISAQRYR